jgi:hypothetical protein
VIVARRLKQMPSFAEMIMASTMIISIVTAVALNIKEGRGKKLPSEKLILNCEFLKVIRTSARRPPFSNGGGIATRLRGVLKL